MRSGCRIALHLRLPILKELDGKLAASKGINGVKERDMKLGGDGEQGSHTGRALPHLKELDGKLASSKGINGVVSLSCAEGAQELTASKRVTRESSLEGARWGADGEHESPTGRALPPLEERDRELTASMGVPREEFSLSVQTERDREVTGEQGSPTGRALPPLKERDGEVTASKKATRGELSLSWRSWMLGAGEGACGKSVKEGAGGEAQATPGASGGGTRRAVPLLEEQDGELTASEGDTEWFPSTALSSFPPLSLHLPALPSSPRSPPPLSLHSPQFPECTAYRPARTCCPLFASPSPPLPPPQSPLPSTHPSFQPSPPPLPPPPLTPHLPPHPPLPLPPSPPSPLISLTLLPFLSPHTPSSPSAPPPNLSFHLHSPLTSSLLSFNSLHTPLPLVPPSAPLPPPTRVLVPSPP
ncbi:unnamed protein product [Closterium sp. NIES-64]|nr:unnamed protein product [Closterium sp. NIES-64]